MKILDAVFVYQMKSRSELLWHGRVHSHGEREYEIHYFLDGDGVFQNGATRYTINPGMMFISLPNSVHAIKATAHDPVTYYAILMSLEEADSELRDFLDHQIESSPHRIGTNYRFFFEEVKEKALSGSSSRHLSACHQMASLLYQASAGESRVQGGHESRHLERALKIMQKNVFNYLTLTDLAEQLNLSDSYLVRLFRSRMKQSPMRYFMKLKIEAASAMLTCTDMSVKEIAARLSFSSEFHFSKQFKAKTGLSPSHYRTRYLQELGSQEKKGEDRT